MSERWTRVTELFDRALGQTPAQRERFLAAECGDDTALADEVRSLLAHHDASRDFLEPSRTALLAPGSDPPGASPREGSVVGAWRVVRPLGEGGMGVVWLAERVDGQFTQQGALKLIRFGLAYEEAIRRFRRERQILAALDHPHIARLLDGGTTDDGLPYLVMEYVEGRRLYEHCSERGLDVAARLRLFVTLCGAVHDAHQKLVVHRDLKPGNVMVTAAGSPKLLDFGVAKLLEIGREESADELQTVELPFTPLYASPEHLRGEDVTTASDVYSLGVILYELLTGVHPYPTRSGAAADVIRSVLETDPARPSAATGTAAPRAAAGSSTPLPSPPAEPAALRRRLAGDLDNIVLKAMDKDPARRYASAERLAADVERYLEGRPVSARGDSWSYRTSKFVRRNRVAVAAGTLAVLALLAGLGVSLRQAAVARRERTLAEHRLRDVQALTNTLMFDVYDGIENMPGATDVRRRVIEKVAGYLDALGAQAGRDSSLRFGLADAYERLGIAQHTALAAAAGDSPEALHTFERCRAMRLALLREFPDNERALAGLVQVDSRLGNEDEIQGRLPEALDYMRQAAQANERLVALHPENLDYAAGLPKRHNNLGLALLYNDRPAEAGREARRAAEGFASLAARDTADWRQRRLLAMSLTVLSDCLPGRSPAVADSVEAVERRALAIYDALWHRRPNDLDLELRVADGHERLAQILLFHSTHGDSACSQVDIAQRMVEAVAARDTADHDRDVDVVNGRVTMAFVHVAAGRGPGAARELEAAAPAFARLAAHSPGDTRVQGDLVQLELARALVARERARGGGAAASRPEWRVAAAAYARAREALPHADPWGLEAEEAAWIARGRAECDSALAAPVGVSLQRESVRLTAT